MVEVSDDDWARRYSPEEQQALTEQLLELTDAVHAGRFASRRLDLSLLQQLHAALFRGVRDHAGRIRDRDFGSERLTFGPRVSEHRDHVRGKLGNLFADTGRNLRMLRDSTSLPGYELEALRLAVWVHAEIIRVHPFEDGNGRTSRLCASHVLVQLGLRPIPIEAVKQEYTGALNRYFSTGDMDPLLDLHLSLYPVDR